MTSREREERNPYAYQSPYQDEWEALEDDITNRPAFKFDVNEEALYDYYNGEHQRQARVAKMDTEGELAGLTGGYDNSYARQRGQQAYDKRMDALHDDVVPALRQTALDKYEADSDALAQRYENLQDAEDEAYKDWEKEYGDLYEDYESENEDTGALDWKPVMPGLLGDVSGGNFSPGQFDSAVDRVSGLFPHDVAAVTSVAPSAPSITAGVAASTAQTTAAKNQQYVSQILGSNTFAGSNFAQAVAKMRAGGVSNDIISGLLSREDWETAVEQAVKELEAGKTDVAPELLVYNNYTEYMRAYVQYSLQNRYGSGWDFSKFSWSYYLVQPEEFQRAASADEARLMSNESAQRVRELAWLQMENEALTERLQTVATSETEQEQNRMGEIYQQYGDIDEALAKARLEDDVLHNEAEYLSVLRRVKNAPDFAEKSAIDGYFPNWGIFAYVNDEERAVYNYLYATEGIESAMAFLTTRENLLKQRYGEAMAEDVKGNFLEQMAIKAEAGIDQFTSGIASLFNDGEAKSPSALQYANAAVDEDLGNVDLKWYNFAEGKWVDQKIFGRSLGQIAGDTTQTLTNLAPSVAAGYINPWAGAILMGSSAAGNSYQDMLNQGYSKDTAAAYGVMTGLSEVALEKVLGGITALGGGRLTAKMTKNLSKVDDVLTRFAKSTGGKVLLNAGSEAIEEGLQAILDPYFKAIVTGEEFTMDMEETLYNALMGFVTGGVLEGSPAAIGSTVTHVKNAKQNAQIRQMYRGSQQDLVTEALELDPENAFAKQMQDKLDKSKNLSGSELNKLVQMNETAIEQGKSSLEDAQQPQTAVDTALGKNVARTPKAAVSAQTGAVDVSAATVRNGRKAEITAASPELEAASKKYGAQAATMESAYQEGQDVERFDREYKLAYDMSKEGASQELLESGGAFAYLTAQQKNIAYQSGAAAAAQGQRKRGTVKGYGVDVKAMAQAFNVNQAYAYKAIAQIADVTGVDVVLFESKPDANGELRGGVIDGIDMSNTQGAFSWHNNKIYIDINAGVLRGVDMGDVAKYSMLRTFTHEFTHFIEKHNAEQYDAFRELVFDTMRRNGTDPDELTQAYMDRHEGTTRDAASREVVAEAMTDILPQSRFVEELAQKHEGIFKTLRNKLKNFVKRIKAYFKNIGSSQSAEVAAVTQYMDGALRYAQEIVEAFDRVAVQAVENYQADQVAQKNTATEGGVQMQIREIGDAGKFYVQADRQVLTGDDPSTWGKQIEKYINEIIRKEQDIAIPTQDGHVLLLTGRSAYKLSDAHVAAIQKKVEALLTDESYALKGRAATHIDELVQVARFSKYKPDVNRKHDNDIGEDGFNYFKSHFRDFDGEYYEIMFSAGLNENEETVYSIGSIRKRSFPASTGSSSKTEALKGSRKASGDIIYTSSGKSQEVKSAIQLAYENALAKKSSGQQNQERKGTITNRDIIAQIEGETELEREKLKEYQDILNKAQEQSQIAAQKQKELDELLKAEGPKDEKKILTAKEDVMKAKNRRSTYEGMLHRMETGILSVLIEREKGPILEKLRNTYGTIPKGEKAVRDDSLPVSVDGKTKVSRTARTVKGAGVTPDDFVDLIDTEVVKGGLSYVPITNDKTTQEAVEWISNEGWEMARAKWHTEVQAGKTGADLVARGALLLNNAAKAGDKNAWLDILHDYQFLGTKTAQGMQAMKILKKLAPEDKLHTIKRSIAQMVKDMKLGFEITIDPELETAYRNAKTAKEAKKLLAEIQQSVADQIPSTWMDKWTALRYLNMLGNLRTQIRNVFGNTGMMLVTGTKDAVAVGLEQIAYAASGGQFRKTKSLVVSGEMLKAARADYELVESIIQGGGKYSDSRNESMEFARAVREKQRIFRSKMGVPLEMYRKGTNWAMEKGDVFFSKIAYAKALAGYLKANGVKGGDFSEVDTLLMNEARLYAVQEAQEATFRDTNALSKWVSTLGRKDTTWAPIRTISEGVMPFRKTPANVLVRAEEYSPLGIVNSLYKSIRAMQKGSDVTGAQVINSWAKTLTGTGLFALGMLLQSRGILIGGPDEDDKLDQFEDLNGQQNYALKFGDVYITIDWLSPMAMPLFMGGQTKKLMEEGGIQFKDVEKVLTSIADPMIQMSMLQGVNDTLENVRYAENNMGQLLINAAVSYLTQGLTNTLLGQMERGFEEQRMSTYVDKNSAMPDWMQKALGKASAKMPGWDYNQIPYINAWGQEEQNPAPWLNLPYNMLSPSYVSQGQEDAVSQELTRLNEVQGDVNVFPSTPEKKYGDRYLSSDEYVALAKAQGQTQRQIVEGMVGSELYEGLPDAYKAKAIELAYGYARESAQIEVLGRDGFTSDWMAELGEDTAQGILKHVIGENIKSMYLGGDITAEEALKRRMEYHGDTEDEAKETVAYWDFQTENPQYADWRQDTVTKYKDLEPDTAAHVIEVLGGLSAEDGYTNVRPIQKLEAIASDRDLSAKDKETAMRANMDSNLEAKYDTARDMGISMNNFVKAYRKYQDTSGEGKKATVIAYYKRTFGISNSKAEKLYDLLAGNK